MSPALNCFFASDLHGKTERYAKLFQAMADESPDVVLLGGDLLPMGEADFIEGFLIPGFQNLKARMQDSYPAVLAIFGNDDPRVLEPAMMMGEQQGLWTYLHGRKREIESMVFYGYAFVPPTPFRLKDWERYDVSRYVDPGCMDPVEGSHSTPVSESEVKYSTIEKDLKDLLRENDLSRTIILFHTPPYQTKLDRAALDRKMVDHAPVDVHVGSIAVRKFIETRKPLLTLHGHIHESPHITGYWKDRIGDTWLYSAAHDGPELALVRFRTDALDQATRALI